MTRASIGCPLGVRQMTDKVSTGLVKAPPTPFAKERHRATGCDPVGRPGRRTLAQQRFDMPLDPHETRYLHDPIEQFARNDRLKYSDVAGDAWVIWSALVLALGVEAHAPILRAGRPARRARSHILGDRGLACGLPGDPRRRLPSPRPSRLQRASPMRWSWSWWPLHGVCWVAGPPGDGFRGRGLGLVDAL